MSDEHVVEYDENTISVLEAVWGEGFMSPGGTEEIDRVLGNVDLTWISVRLAYLISAVGLVAQQFILRSPGSRWR